MFRYAIARGATSRHQLSAYLPSNYRIVEENACGRCGGKGEIESAGAISVCQACSGSGTASSAVFIIEGEDAMGWTLDGYVIPRCASGLIWVEEIQGDHPALQAVSGLPWGYAVLDARGEPYALRESLFAAKDALRAAEGYLDGAATCGHPAAGPWVALRTPLVIQLVTRGERAELLEEWGTPTLDREP